ncbi:D-lactate ferricytochrome c oxidoreductase [Microbotryomycetes sp. JL221]|nr:D-lactate ferricytochrome c oxidoreductase [Microbotryomycetes sp. JL221]
MTSRRAQSRLGSILSQLSAWTSPSINAVDAAISDLQTSLKSDQVDTSDITRALYGTTWGTYVPPTPPAVVVFAESTQDVVNVVNVATKHRIVLIPTAGRTSLEGQFLPPTCCNPPSAHRTLATSKSARVLSMSQSIPTIHLDVTRMNKVLAVYEADSQAIVQPGVGWKDLGDELESRGVKMFFPIDPSPKAMFGGMAGVGGSGTNAVGFGTMRAEWIMGMEVVLMDGRVIRTRGMSRSRKSSTGWDVGRLFIGSEGTLGIITELTVRLAPIVPLRVAITSFPTVVQAVDAVVDILGAGLTPTSLELLDDMSIRGLNLAELLEKPLPEEPTIMMRFSSSVSEVITSSLESVAKIVRKHGGRELMIAKDEKENERFWNARKAQYWSQQLLITDICVPISNLAEFVCKSDEFVKTSGLYAPIVAHIGDGNVHRAILYKADSGTNSAPAAVATLASQLSTLAIELEGTCAGEHGIGTSKRKYLRKELGQDTLDLMRRIKRELDPLNLLNPGKVLYSTREEENYGQ